MWRSTLANHSNSIRCRHAKVSITSNGWLPDRILSELCAIAVGSDATKKKWLKEYLENCESSSGVKRELLSLLR